MEQYPTLNHNTATYGKTLKLKRSAVFVAVARFLFDKAAK